MPHASLKLIPGVNQNRTPALNETAISESQLIRFVPDSQGLGLPQKLGGWTKYFANTISSVIRCLWAWTDSNNEKYLAIGAIDLLETLSENVLRDISPRTEVYDVAVDVDTVSGSDQVTINITGSNATSYDSVFIKTQISVGGLVLFGMYKCFAIGANSFNIYATDVLGQPAYATATVTGGGDVPIYDTTNGSSVVVVTLADNGLGVGDTFTALISTTVSGIVIFGNYLITEINAPNEFSIQTSSAATATTTASMNGGDAIYELFIGDGPLPLGTGYGVGPYGAGGYGTGVPPTSNPGTVVAATDWSLDNWGSILIANPFEGAIYEWNPLVNSTVAAVITNAPTNNTGTFVAMPQRQIIAYGSTFNGIIDNLLVRWCDVENYEDWIGSVTNQAGSYRIPRGSRIVGGIQAPQQGLLWTDTACWSMQYIGQPYVYSFNEIGTGCGLIAQKAAGTLNGVVYWMGPSQFYMLAGNGVEPIYCPVWDVIFQDIDLTNVSKIRFAANSLFNEVAWYYPITSSGGEVAKYVKYNAGLRQWDFGTLGRTAWLNQSVLGNPIGASPERYIYQHETSPNDDGQPMLSSFQTGYFALSEADVKTFIDQVWPDMKWGYYGGSQNANVQITFYYTDYAGQTPLVSGPFTVTQSTQYVTPRFRGRLVSIGISSSDIDSFWRLGNIRYRLQPDGKF
jgi:hypothetical protein